MPTIFADGVADNRPQVVGQVVMSMSGFLDAAAFFEAIVKDYVEKGIVSRDRVDEAWIQAGLPPG